MHHTTELNEYWYCKYCYFLKKTFILSQDFVSNIMMDRRTSPFKIYVLARLIV